MFGLRFQLSAKLICSVLCIAAGLFAQPAPDPAARVRKLPLWEEPTAPKLTRPPQAREISSSGAEVVLIGVMVTLDADGRVANARVESSENRALHQRAIKIAKQAIIRPVSWRFFPASREIYLPIVIRIPVQTPEAYRLGLRGAPGQAPPK